MVSLVKVLSMARRAVALSVLAMVLVAGPWGAFAHAEDEEAQDANRTVLAKVNSQELISFDLEEAYQEIVPAGAFHGMNPEKRERYRDQAMQKMIERELLYQEAKRLGMKADKKTLNDMYETRVEKMGGKSNFLAIIKRIGMKDKEYKQRLEKRLLVEAVLKAEVDDKAAVSEQEALAAYEANKQQYMRPEARHVNHILVSVAPSSSEEGWAERLKRANEALDKLKAGEPFSSVAWDYSNDPYAVKGGDMGLLHKGRLDESLETAIWKLPVGQLSEPIKTIYGYHIVLITSKTEPTQMEFKDVAAKITKQMNEDRKKALRANLMASMKEKATIEVMK